MKSETIALFVFGLLTEGVKCSGFVPPVFTTSGIINGISVSSNVNAYYKIPFAKPPVGNLRFKAPEPLFSPLVNRPAAPDPGPACMQRKNTFLPPYAEESEDCLYLNVWKSKSHSFGLKPVLVWIHGGAFNLGSANSPNTFFDNFASTHQDIVYVSFNYRHNFFGYANTGFLSSSHSNAGLRDVRAAVEWLRQNIASFGGNPNHIVLYGESAGASIIHTYLFGYQHNHYIKGAILSSGSVYFAGSNTQTISSGVWNDVAAAAGCTGTPAQVFTCMQGLSSTALKDAIDVGTAGKGTVPYVDNQLIWGYQDFQTRAHQGKFAKVPLLTGHNANEGDIFFWNPVTNTVDYAAADQFGFETFVCFDGFTAKTHAAKGVSVYRYKYEGLWPTISVPPVRVTHGFEMPMVFKKPGGGGLPLTTDELAASTFVQRIWATFTKNPANGLLGTFSWPKYDTTQNTLARLFEDNDLVTPISLADPLAGEEGCAAVLAGTDPVIPS